MHEDAETKGVDDDDESRFTEWVLINDESIELEECNPDRFQHQAIYASVSLFNPPKTFRY